MSLLKKIFTPSRLSGTSFNRYYVGVARQGAGYPTADEARKDYATRARQSFPYGFPM